MARRDYDTYQFLGDDREYHWKNEREKYSKFWNVGKWDNFVAPLLPRNAEDMTFVDLGCNAGLFLKLAKDYGFKYATGVDSHLPALQRGRDWRDANGYQYDMILSRLEELVNDLPMADVTLMSNMHYYLRLNHWVKLVDRLRTRTRILIIINRAPRRMNHYELLVRRLDRFFTEWSTGETIQISTKGDPAPRRIKAHRYDSTIVSRIAIDDIEDHALSGILDSFYRDGDVELYFQWFRLNRNWSDERIRRQLHQLKKTKVSIGEVGQNLPILINRHNRVLDGIHRVASMKALGYQTILARYI